MRKVTMLAFALLMMVSFSFAANVTFKVNMMAPIDQGIFNPTSDYVDIAGSFNGWDGASHHLTDADSDSIWDITIDIAEGDIQFKFRLNGSWDAGQCETDPNRTHTVCAGDQVLDLWYNRESVAPVVIFKVDMQDQINTGNFDPSSDYVDVAGSFNGWDGASYHLAATPCNDAIWTLAVSEGLAVDDVLNFKFRINSSWDAGMCDSDPNRTHTVVANVQEYSDFWNRYDYNFAVTFEVNMSYQIKQGNFIVGTDYVDVAGNFNGWDGANQHLTDDDADSIWAITLDSLMVPGDTLYFKFRINGSWDAGKCESDPNREYITEGGKQVYSDWWNRFDPNFVGSDVQFSVNMNAQITAGLFDPSVNNTVKVKGSFDGWAGTNMSDDDSDGIYTVTSPVPIGPIQYLFTFVDTAGIIVSETLTQNRRYTVELSAETIILETVWFNNVQAVTYGSGNITFRVDMTVLQALGFYDRALGDSLELRGGFNGWGSDADRSTINMYRQTGTEIYFLTVPYEGYTGDNIAYKFFLNLHTGADHAGEDFYEYELPSSWGGGNRWFTWHGMDQDTLMPIQTFQDYVTEGVTSEDDSVLVHLRIDMTDALTYEEDAFEPENDRLFFAWYDAWGALLQGTAALNVPDDSAKYEYHPTDVENIWECSFYIHGPAPHAIIYKTRYIKSDGTEIEESGPGDSYGRYRTQWIKPTAAGILPDEETLDVVLFSTEGTALEVELEPFANGLVYNEIVKSKVILPSVMKLNQNYPNPFNPTTQIKFSITRANDVTLTIYNILGQMVTKESYINLQAGNYSFLWNSRDLNGNSVASGVYFYELNVGNEFRDIKKMVLMK